MVAFTGAIVFAIAGCGGGATDAPQSDRPSVSRSDSEAASKLVGPVDFATVIAKPERLTINVHVPFEGVLPGTDLLIPYDQIRQRASELPSKRSAPLAIYCKSGNMSADAARDLAALGYTDVVELDGGMDAWRASGRNVSQTRPTG